jgi:hypothetical protein
MISVAAERQCPAYTTFMTSLPSCGGKAQLLLVSLDFELLADGSLLPEVQAMLSNVCAVFCSAKYSQYEYRLLTTCSKGPTKLAMSVFGRSKAMTHLLYAEKANDVLME